MPVFLSSSRLSTPCQKCSGNLGRRMSYQAWNHQRYPTSWSTSSLPGGVFPADLIIALLQMSIGPLGKLNSQIWDIASVFFFTFLFITSLSCVWWSQFIQHLIWMGAEIADSSSKQMDFLWSIDIVNYFSNGLLWGPGWGNVIAIFPLSFSISCV